MYMATGLQSFRYRGKIDEVNLYLWSERERVDK